MTLTELLPKVSFARNVSPQEAEQFWVPIIEVTIGSIPVWQIYPNRQDIDF